MSAYAYVLLSLFSLLAWAACYRMVDEESRKEMVISGLIIIPLGIAFQLFFWTKDWWLPHTLTGTLVGIEDIVYGFATTGIFVALPLAVLGKRISIEGAKQHHTMGMLLLSALCVALLAVLFYVFHVHSFYASVVSVVVPALIVFMLRRDLIPFSLMSTALCLLASLLLFALVDLFQPGFIHDIWQMEKLSGILIFSTPMEDAVWYATSAMFCSVIYKYWRRGKVSYWWTQTRPR